MNQKKAKMRKQINDELIKLASANKILEISPKGEGDYIRWKDLRKK